MFSLLASSFASSGLQLIGRKPFFDEANDIEFWLSVCVPITNSSREKLVSPKSKLPSTSEQLSTVVRSTSQLERHCYSGGSRYVEADGDDWSSPSSGSVLPSIIFYIQTLVSNDILEQRSRGLEGWARAVLIGATMACAAARPLLSMMMLSNLASSSSMQPSISFNIFLSLCSDPSVSDRVISFFNAFTAAHTLAVVFSGVGGSRL